MENTPRGFAARTGEQQVPASDSVQADKALAVIILGANLLQASTVIATDGGNSGVSGGLVTKLS
jgi:hypothetical protein